MRDPREVLAAALAEQSPDDDDLRDWLTDRAEFVEDALAAAGITIVYGTCRDCGRADRLLARDTRTCVVEVYDRAADAYVMRSNPACRGGAG